MTVESICIGQVLCPNPAYHSLLVQFRSSQIPTQPVRMLYNGPADPLCVNQAEMPRAGTWGLVAFPNGDIRNGIWLGSIFGDWRDSLMAGVLSGEDCAVADDPRMAYMRYESQWSGFWNYSGFDAATEEHKTAMQWPDKSSFVIGVDEELPAINRQTVDDGEHRVQEDFTMDDRVEDFPTDPFELKYQHASGTNVQIDATGDVLIEGGTDEDLTNLLTDAPSDPATFTIKFNGTTIEIDDGGNLSMIGADGSNFLTSFGGSTIVIDAAGNMSLNGSPDASLTVNFAGSNMSMNAAGIVLASPMPITIVGTPTSIDGRIFLLHDHSLVFSGTDISGPVV